MARSNPFGRVGGITPGRSVFDLSHEKKFTADMGILYPVMLMKCVPGDIIKLGFEGVVRHQPLVSPPIHEVNVYSYDFFVPFRILATKAGFNFEKYYTKGKDGKALDTTPKYTSSSADLVKGSLWDHFGFPMVANIVIDAWPFLAYNAIFNEYFRDQDLINRIVNPFLKTDPEDTEVYDPMPTMPRRRCWERDYFTSCRPFQQRGPELAVPISNILNQTWINNSVAEMTVPPNANVLVNNDSANVPPYLGALAGNSAVFNLKNFFAGLARNFNTASFDVKDLRDIWQMQKWMERNARAGVRFTEFLRSHFGVHPTDERLDRPEYIGGHKAPVIFSEVLQTSQTDSSPQGNLAGHGITADRTYIGKYSVKEPGIIMRVFSVMPRTTYAQGVNRQWQTQSIYDEYFREFANLSEQGVYQQEIYATGVASNDKKVFGFIPKYDEYRYLPSYYSSGMRSDFKHWHFGRAFGTSPNLNREFVECTPRKDPYAVPSEDCLVVNVGNLVRAIRPMPRLGEPGLVDHH